jgi:hypothetical protein
MIAPVRLISANGRYLRIRDVSAMSRIDVKGTLKILGKGRGVRASNGRRAEARLRPSTNPLRGIATAGTVVRIS